MRNIEDEDLLYFWLCNQGWNDGVFKGLRFVRREKNHSCLFISFLGMIEWVPRFPLSLKKKILHCCLVRQGGNSLNFKMILQRKVEMYLRNDKNVNSVCLSFSYSYVESGTQARHLFLFDFFIIFYSLPFTFLKFIQSFSFSSSALPSQNADSVA